jgi:hypothetical protein
VLRDLRTEGVLMTEHRSWVTRIGLLVVAAAAAVMSFTALADLARLVGITGTVGAVGTWAAVPTAALLPITVDVYAAVATWVWLQGRAPADAVEFARRSAWAAIVTTVVGNAVHGGLVALTASPPWWMAVLIGAIPPAALGALVHLAVLVGRVPDRAVGEPVRVDPLAGLTEQLLTQPWDRPVGEWSARIARAQRVVPDRSEPDEVLARDLLRADADRRSGGGRELSRDDVITRYGVGATRAGRLRALAESLAEPTAADRPVRAVAS